jgi:hypothetical protein
MPVALLASQNADTTIVLPSALRATAWPNSALICGFEGLTYACCDQRSPVRAKTYTAPALKTESSR